MAGRSEVDAFVEADNGLANLVRRLSASAADLTPREQVDGKAALAKKVRGWRTGLLPYRLPTPLPGSLASRDLAGNSEPSGR